MKNVLKKIGDLHDALYAVMRASIRSAKKEAPHIGKHIAIILEDAAEKRTVRVWFIFLCLIIFSFSVYNRSSRYFATTDALPNNYTTMNLIFNHRIDLTNLKKSLDKKDLSGIYVKNEHGVVYPKTSVLLGILAVPFYKAMFALQGISKMDTETLILTRYAQYVGKWYASFLSAVSVGFMFLIFLQIGFSQKRSAGLSLIYALCTNIFNIASQSNIQHGISIFLVTLAMLIFFYLPKKIWGLVLAGAIIGLSAQIRISNGFYMLFFLMLSKINIRKVGPLILGFFLAYLPILYFFHILNIPNGYAQEIMFSLHIWTPERFVDNLWAYLFSYNYGLFVFSPIFIVLILAGLFAREHDKKFAPLVLPAVFTIIIFIAFAASWWMWTGGLSYGARLIIEAIPLGILLIGIFYDSLKKLPAFKFTLATLIFLSIYFNILTTFVADKTWQDWYTKPGHEAQIRNAWFDNPTFLGFLMQHQYYVDEHLHMDGKTFEVNKRWYWASFYDKKVTRVKSRSIQILPITKGQ